MNNNFNFKAAKDRLLKEGYEEQGFESEDEMEDYYNDSDFLDETEELSEMAKIAGDLKSSIEAVLKSNPDLEGLALKKAIKGDAAVISALGEDDLFDNQLNKFISLTKGERTLGQRGRIADPNKASAEPKIKITTPKAPGQTSSKLADLAPSSIADEENEMADTMAKGENRLGTDAEKLAQVSKEMKALIPSFKSAEGAEKAAITAQLKALTAEKKALDAKMFK